VSCCLPLGWPQELPADVAPPLKEHIVRAMIYAAPKPVRAMRFNHFKVLRQCDPPLRRDLLRARYAPLAAATVKQFSDGEVHLQIQENVRGADVLSPADVHSGGYASDGTAADDGRAQARSAERTRQCTHMGTRDRIVRTVRVCRFRRGGGSLWSAPEPTAFWRWIYTRRRSKVLDVRGSSVRDAGDDRLLLRVRREAMTVVSPDAAV